MPTIVGVLTLMGTVNYMLSWVEHEKFDNIGAWKDQEPFYDIEVNSNRLPIGHWHENVLYHL